MISSNFINRLTFTSRLPQHIPGIQFFTTSILGVFAWQSWKFVLSLGRLHYMYVSVPKSIYWEHIYVHVPEPKWMHVPCYSRTIRYVQHIFWEKNNWLITGTSIRNAFIFFPMSILWSTFGVLIVMCIYFHFKIFFHETNLIYNHWIKLYIIF